MTNAEVQALITSGLALISEGEALLKQTTVGYKNQKPAWYTNTTTQWWKGLDKIRQGKAKIAEAKVEVGKLVSPPPDPPDIPPDPPVSGSKGLGLLMYAGVLTERTGGDIDQFDMVVSSYGEIGDYQYVSQVNVPHGPGAWWSSISEATAIANPSWYLTMPGGAIASPPAYPYNKTMNPGIVAYQNEWANQVIAHMDLIPGCKGVFCDDVLGTPDALLEAWPTQYPGPSYRETWKAAVIAFFKNVTPKLNAAGYRVIVNTNNHIAGDSRSNWGELDVIWFKQLGPFVDGIHREYWEQDGTVGATPHYDIAVPDTWKAHFSKWLDLPLACQSVGCDFYCTFTPIDTTKNARLLRGAFLLTWDGGPGAMMYLPNGYAPGPGVQWEWPEAQRYLGAPTAPAVRMNLGWKRTFTHGKLLLNATKAAMVIDGVTVPAQDAVYLSV